jgi:predicted esterase
MKHLLQSEKTFRYFTQGNILNAKKLIYVLHGYGQLAEFFLRNFKELDSDYYVVAPEGMHRFYLHGNSGRVGASWMTKEARDQDIHDTLQWLNKLDHKICAQTTTFEHKIILGFSQGGATAARWNSVGKIKANTFISWASVFPPDLDNTISDRLKGKQHNYFILGKDDEYFTDDERENILEYYKQKNFKTIVFEGKHVINMDALKIVLKEL